MYGCLVGGWVGLCVGGWAYKLAGCGAHGGGGECSGTGHTGTTSTRVESMRCNYMFINSNTGNMSATRTADSGHRRRPRSVIFKRQLTAAFRPGFLRRRQRARTETDGHTSYPQS